MKSLISYFEFAIEQHASDIHLVAGEVPAVRINGELKAIKDEPLSDKSLQTSVFGLLTDEQKKRYQDDLELDFAYQMDSTRFRINLHQQQGMMGLTARIIPSKIPTPEALRFEPALYDFSTMLDGLVLVVGPTGSGKSTTIASMIQSINMSRKAHIVTVEDPIEFLFTDDQCLIEQREIGVDTHSFAASLKHVLRQDPDIILVGEMRDPETIATVLTAAETGHLVFSTLHTSSAAEAVGRIVDVFEGSKQKQILVQLSSVLRGVVAQQLLPTVDGKRVVAREVLVNTPAVSNLIRENNIAQIASAMQTGAKDGMVTMEQSVKTLVKEDLIDKEVAERRIGKLRHV